MRTISFFSFKGGVGRTLLLANLGAYWAEQGKVVALIDLDLMAPGLSYSPLAGEYLYPQEHDLGMSDLLADLPAQLGKERYQFLLPHRLLRNMDLAQVSRRQQPPSERHREPAGRLLLIDAGHHRTSGLGSGEEGVIDSISPRGGRPGETEAQRLFRTLAHHLRRDLEDWRVPDGPCAGRPIDYLLVDSRTGFAELLDLSLGYLAEKIVLVSGLNAQNLEGLRVTLKALLDTKEPRIPMDELRRQLSVVFSPIPATEDETIAQIRRQVLKQIEPGGTETDARPTEIPAGTATPRRPNPLGNLPAWTWPLGDLDAEAKDTALDALLEQHPDAGIDRLALLNRLSRSFSFKIEKKQRIIDQFSKLSRQQLKQLIGILEKERSEFEPMVESHTNDIFKLFHEYLSQWAGLVLKDPKAGWRRYLLAPLNGETLFEHAEAWPEYWLGLARECFVRLADREHALQAMEHGRRCSTDPAAYAVALVDLLPDNADADQQQTLEAVAHQLAPQGSAPLTLALARRRIKAETPDQAAAAQLLRPLLEDPPDDAKLCFRAAALALDELPELAPRTEAALRKAIEIDPKYAYPWNSLGNLLKNHLTRYDEAETAYRNAIEIDPKFASSWNGLGLLQRTVYRDCTAARKSFAKGLDAAENDVKAVAYLRMNLGHLSLLLGESGTARTDLEMAYRGFAEQPGFEANALRLAVKLAEPEAITKQSGQAWERLKADENDTWALAELLCATLATGEDTAPLWQRILATLDSYDEHFDLIDEIHLLAGMRDSAQEGARILVAELLRLDPTITSKFRDHPKPADWYARYRPFSEGHSRGAGDPADRQRFCAAASAPDSDNPGDG